jgi:hypothetical protein
MSWAEDILDSNRDRINNIKERRNDKVAWWVPISLIIFAIISFLAIWYLKRRDRLRGPRREELERALMQVRAMGLREAQNIELAAEMLRRRQLENIERLKGLSRGDRRKLRNLGGGNPEQGETR